MDDDTRSPFKKRHEYKEHSSYHFFQLDWVWDDALVMQNIFAFASRSRQHHGIGWNVSSYEKFLPAQFVKNQNVNTVKTCLVFLTIDRNAEILSGGFNDRFSGCWMYWLFVNFLLPGKLLNNCARESRYFKYNIPKLKEFVQSKSRTSFKIASHFLTNIEFSHRVPTSVFVEIYLWELTTESEYDFFLKCRNIEIFWYVQTRKFPLPQRQNYDWNCLTMLTFLNKYLQF